MIDYKDRSWPDEPVGPVTPGEAASCFLGMLAIAIGGYVLAVCLFCF